MEIQTFDQLIARVKSSRRQFRVAVANAGDAHTLEAVLLACREGVVSPILVGDRAEILRICKEQSADFPAEDIVDAAGAPEAAAKAVELVREGKADFLMKGKMDTGVLLKAVVNKETGLGTGNLMSIFLLAQLPNYHKLVAVVDGGMVPYPTLEQKKGIIENTVGALRDLGYESPKVGVLACIEKVNPKMPETVEADALKQMNRAGEIQNCIVEGPVSYDCAMSREIAGLKGFDSPCAGDCDALIAPDIHAGNILTKALHVTGGAATAGFIVGAKCPIVMSSRGSEPEEKFMSIILAAAVVLGRG
ncbi:MAG: phosphate butyryltransferase [Clostridiales bacterium]|uniref:phosphate acyltransferase n=1 Tax=Provencibacterium massiliense TaxID=1841868 RepID=UPI0009A58CFF|nr:phosphate acyltransferase [Provencibacterium massiliense]PWM37606.1 MAG: phosphate butyryltransferase [Clostridiales bacterium]RGB69996.1 phosphate butyryltransferase [Harryflintia acetispora]